MKRALMIIAAVLICGCSGRKEQQTAVSYEVPSNTPETEELTPVEDMLVSEEEAQELIQQTPEAEETGKPRTPDEPDLNLAFMSSTVIYSEIYNMMMEPEDYAGKTIRVQGLFSTGDGKDGELIFGVIVPDATACCVQGIEIRREGDYVWPDDYPENGEPIVVQGVLSYEKEEYTTWLALENAEIWLTNE